jgi:hypothetical protein
MYSDDVTAGWFRRYWRYTPSRAPVPGQQQPSCWDATILNYNRSFTASLAEENLGGWRGFIKSGRGDILYTLPK